MITLIILSLIALGIIYLLLFGILKLIWILCKSNRNFWPLVLAGAGTLLFCISFIAASWWGFRMVMEPFKPMIARVKANPQIIIGNRVYQDDTFPFELNVFDGMDFSQWILFDKTNLKIGVDTNAFKNKDANKDSFLALLILRTPIQNKEDPFAPWQSFKNDPNAKNRFKIIREERTTINGLPAYRIEGEAYSNRGLQKAWIAIIAGNDDTLYFLVMTEFGNKDMTSQINATLNSFKITATPTLAPISLSGTSAQ